MRKNRRAQAAVETMLAVPLVTMVLMGMYYLFSVTFAAENAHMRAREYVLHRDTYLSDRSYGTSGSTVWDGSNYKKAERGITNYSYEASATDRSIEGLADYGSLDIDTTAKITSN